MNENLSIQINRFIEHFKIRPTYTIQNNIFISLKNHGYKDIPKLENTSNTVDKKSIDEYCKKIKNLIETEPDIEDPKKKNTSKEVYMFQESSMLPQNVYVSEKKDEEKLEETYIDDITSVSESENSAISEIEEEEGYEIFENNDSEGGFSE